jgi:hypothetical protein
VQAKVDIARAQIAEGRHNSNEEVVAEFAACRDAVRRRIGSPPVKHRDSHQNRGQVDFPMPDTGRKLPA